MEPLSKTAVLRAFLGEQLGARGHVLDDETFRLIEAHVTLSEAEGAEAEEIRSVELQKHTDGKVTGRMFSLYNVSQIGWHDLFGLALKEAAILAMTDETRLKIALALLTLVHDFFKHLNTDLNETEARILLAIYDLEKPEFSTADLQESCRKQFTKPLSGAQIQTLLDAFVRMTILDYDKKKERYFRRQKISLVR